MSMDGFGLALAGVAARATVLGLAGIGVYAWARRRGPSSAATAALAGLLALAGVAALGLAPWPRLWTLDSGMSRGLTTVSAADPASKDAPSTDAADSGRAGSRDPLRSELPASVGPAGLAHVRPGAKTPTWPAGPWSTGATRPGAAPRPGGRALVLDRLAGWFGRPSPTPLPAQPVSEAIPAGIPAGTTSADAIVSGGPEVVFAGAPDTPLSGPAVVVPEAPAPPPTRGGLMGRLERMLVGLGEGRGEPGARPVTSFPSGLGGHAGPPGAPRREEPSEPRAAPEVAAAAPPAAPGGGSDWRGRIEGSLALAFAAGVGLALVRLVAGLWAVERLKGRSRPVEDGAIRATAAELAGAMGLGRPVELRASAFVATPATVGWRRPVVVLPVDWPAWSADERRAVLAHELAHIVRRDYPAWVAAQLSLALHFYHPLAHWLAGRLRLQQELAADATAARHAGGRRAYLAALARMALRQDRGNFVGSAALGPARPFFPRWGTLVRRIEMLRRTEESRRPSSPLATRFVTYGLLVGLGVVLAGLRPPEGRAGGPRAQDPADAGAKAKPERQDRPAPDAPGTLSLDYVPDDAALVVAARPSAILARPEIRALLDAVRGEEGVAQVLAVADPGSIEQITVVLGRSAVGLLAAGGGGDPTALMLAGGVIVRTKSPRDWKSAAGAFLPGITEARHAGQPYYLVPVEEGLSVGFFQPDERTLVVAPVPTLFGFLRPSRGDAGHRWSDAWREVASGEVAVAADVGSLVGPLLPMLSQSEEFAMIGGPVAPLWEETESLAIGLDLSQGFGLRVVASCGSDEGARRVERTLQAVLTLGENASKQVFPMLRRAALGGDGEAAALLTLVDLGEQLLDGAEAERDGLIVRLSLDSKVDLGALVRLVLATL